MTRSSFLKLTPSYRDYVWGGERLRPGHYPTAEAWVVWEGDGIESGPLAGKTLGEAAQQFGDALLGAKTTSHTGTRFPLLIKLLDCAQWLSLQVHPNDEQASKLDPPDLGKTEAWVVIHAEPDSLIYAGLKRGFDRAAFERELRVNLIREHDQVVTLDEFRDLFQFLACHRAAGRVGGEVEHHNFAAGRDYFRNPGGAHRKTGFRLA